MPDGRLLTDVNEILWDIDAIFPSGKTLLNDVIDEPAFKPATPGPDINLDAVLLNIGPGG